MEKDWEEPLFLAAGIFNPHLPFYNAEETFNRYPFETLKMPPMPKGDLDDVGEMARRMVRKEYWIWDNTTAQPREAPRQSSPYGSSLPGRFRLRGSNGRASS